jgi:hypothetical protein
MSIVELATELSKTSEEIVRLKMLREEADAKVESARLVLEQEEQSRKDIISHMDVINHKLETIQQKMRELLTPKEEKTEVIDISDKTPLIATRERWSDDSSDGSVESDRPDKYHQEVLKYSADKLTKKQIEWEKNKKVYVKSTAEEVSVVYSCYIPRLYVPEDVAMNVIKDRLKKAKLTEHLDKLYLVKKNDFGEYASYYLNGLTRTSKQYLVDCNRIYFSGGLIILTTQKKVEPK